VQRYAVISPTPAATFDTSDAANGKASAHGSRVSQLRAAHAAVPPELGALNATSR
jgi:hypothetical protein